MIALLGATLFDGRGSPPLSRAALLVDGERIKATGREGEVLIPPHARVRRLDGLWILPGLIDCHVHLQGKRSLDMRQHVFVGEGLRAARATADLRRLLEAGITTVRDCGSYTALALRQAVAEGSIPGPRIVTVGRFIERTGGADDPTFMPLAWTRAGEYYGPRLADGADDCRRAVREQLRDGADWIKTCSTGAAFVDARSRIDVSEWTTDELRAIVDEAHRLGARVAVHAHAARGIKEAVEAGADTIEHGTCIDDDGCRMMAERGTVLVPTFVTLRRMATVGAEHGAPDFAVSKARALDEEHERAFRRALEHGVPIAMGTDCSGASLSPHGCNAVELELMTAAGLGATESLVASTLGAARALGLEGEIGSVEAGKRADLIVVADDPTRFIKTVQDVRLVMQAGAVVVDRLSAEPS
jgi:imidazolonepropionase-like amidohydrolase